MKFVSFYTSEQTGLIPSFYNINSICMTGDGTLNCKCGSNVREDMVDFGHAWNWPLFPIAALRFGDTGHSPEAVHFRIGPLICEQGKWSDKKWTKGKIDHTNDNYQETAQNPVPTQHGKFRYISQYHLRSWGNMIDLNTTQWLINIPVPVPKNLCHYIAVLVVNYGISNTNVLEIP